MAKRGGNRVAKNRSRQELERALRDEARGENEIALAKAAERPTWMKLALAFANTWGPRGMLNPELVKALQKAQANFENNALEMERAAATQDARAVDRLKRRSAADMRADHDLVISALQAIVQDDLYHTEEVRGAASSLVDQLGGQSDLGPSPAQSQAGAGATEQKVAHGKGSGKRLPGQLERAQRHLASAEQPGRAAAVGKTGESMRKDEGSTGAETVGTKEGLVARDPMSRGKARPVEPFEFTQEELANISALMKYNFTTEQIAEAEDLAKKRKDPKFERCVTDVKAQNAKGGKQVNPWAVCHHALKKESKVAEAALGLRKGNTAPEDFSSWVAFLPLSKRDEDERMVEGFCSSSRIDTQDDIVDPEAIDGALPDFRQWSNLREMHENIASGTVQEIERVTGDVTLLDGSVLKYDKEGRSVTLPDGTVVVDPMHIVARVEDDGSWAKVKKGVLKGFSIGGKTLDWVMEHIAGTGKMIRRITKLLLTEVSLVDRPANPDARILVFKRYKDEAEISKACQEALCKLDDEEGEGGLDPAYSLEDEEYINEFFRVDIPASYLDTLEDEEAKQEFAIQQARGQASTWKTPANWQFVKWLKNGKAEVVRTSRIQPGERRGPSLGDRRNYRSLPEAKGPEETFSNAAGAKLRKDERDYPEGATTHWLSEVARSYAASGTGDEVRRWARGMGLYVPSDDRDEWDMALFDYLESEETAKKFLDRFFPEPKGAKVKGKPAKKLAKQAGLTLDNEGDEVALDSLAAFMQFTDNTPLINDPNFRLVVQTLADSDVARRNKEADKVVTLHLKREADRAAATFTGMDGKGLGAYVPLTLYIPQQKDRTVVEPESAQAPVEATEPTTTSEVVEQRQLAAAARSVLRKGAGADMLDAAYKRDGQGVWNALRRLLQEDPDPPFWVKDEVQSKLRNQDWKGIGRIAYELASEGKVAGSELRKYAVQTRQDAIDSLTAVGVNYRNPQAQGMLDEFERLQDMAPDDTFRFEVEAVDGQTVKVTLYHGNRAVWTEDFNSNFDRPPEPKFTQAEKAKLRKAYQQYWPRLKRAADDQNYQEARRVIREMQASREADTKSAGDEAWDHLRGLGGKGNPARHWGAISRIADGLMEPSGEDLEAIEREEDEENRRSHRGRYDIGGLDEAGGWDDYQAAAGSNLRKDRWDGEDAEEILQDMIDYMRAHVDDYDDPSDLFEAAAQFYGLRGENLSVIGDEAAAAAEQIMEEASGNSEPIDLDVELDREARHYKDLPRNEDRTIGVFSNAAKSFLRKGLTDRQRMTMKARLSEQDLRILAQAAKNPDIKMPEEARRLLAGEEEEAPEAEAGEKEKAPAAANLPKNMPPDTDIASFMTGFLRRNPQEGIVSAAAGMGLTGSQLAMAPLIAAAFIKEKDLLSKFGVQARVEIEKYIENKIKQIMGKMNVKSKAEVKAAESILRKAAEMRKQSNPVYERVTQFIQQHSGALPGGFTSGLVAASRGGNAKVAIKYLEANMPNSADRDMVRDLTTLFADLDSLEAQAAPEPAVSEPEPKTTEEVIGMREEPIAPGGPETPEEEGEEFKVAKRQQHLPTGTPEENKLLLSQIERGDRVTIVTPQGQERSGKAVTRSGEGGRALDMGGAHGTPGLVNERNIVRVKKPSARKGDESGDLRKAEAGGMAAMAGVLAKDPEKANDLMRALSMLGPEAKGIIPRIQKAVKAGDWMTVLKLAVPVLGAGVTAAAVMGVAMPAGVVAAGAALPAAAALLLAAEDRFGKVVDGLVEKADVGVEKILGLSEQEKLKSTRQRAAVTQQRAETTRQLTAAQQELVSALGEAIKAKDQNKVNQILERGKRGGWRFPAAMFQAGAKGDWNLLGQLFGQAFGQQLSGLAKPVQGVAGLVTGAVEAVTGKTAKSEDQKAAPIPMKKALFSDLNSGRVSELRKALRLLGEQPGAEVFSKIAEDLADLDRGISMSVNPVLEAYLSKPGELEKAEGEPAQVDDSTVLHNIIRTIAQLLTDKGDALGGSIIGLYQQATQAEQPAAGQEASAGVPGGEATPAPGEVGVGEEVAGGAAAIPPVGEEAVPGA